MSGEQIATPELDGTGDAGPVDGPAMTVGYASESCEASPSTSAEPNEPEPIDHRVDWTRQATWHLRKIARLEARKFDATKAFDAEIRRLEEKRDLTVGQLDKDIAWHRAPLIQLHRALLADDPTRKTITLPYGQLKSSTPQKPTVRIMDRDAFVEWAKVNAPQLLEVKYQTTARRISAALGDTLQPVGTPKVGWSADLATVAGEIVPGVTLGLDDTTFSVVHDGEL